MNSQQTLTLKTEIERALQASGAGPLAGRAAALLAALGYHSDRTEALSPNDFSGFQETFLDGKAFDAEKALAPQWQTVDLLFQYTDTEVKASSQLALDVFADPRFDAGVYQSFVFFAVDLTGDSYTRTQLADATREINKPFGMPVIVVFRHGATLTLAVIDRRLNKRDGTRDVLEKVTLIKDIRISADVRPHRAHVEILADLALDRLLESHSITNFDTLHTAWRKTLDTAALNKKFYKELADWYFWALKHVTFPPQPGVAADVNAATNVIRLITRLMFTWFLKERGLVPDDLFDERKLTALLQDPALLGDSSTYYKAILQNLFFATLNTERDDPAHPRRFRGRNQSGGRDSHHGIPNVLRYDSSFHDTSAALALFAPIPFLNGGLFECLDIARTETTKRVLIDGFSDRDDNPLRVPNFLFFSGPRDVDLNTVYGTTGKTTKVRGLLTILNSYKFTVAENTPIEEEIALDPELLGRVFENLLASYNPETGATARKQTGSFYTPREIVNYMVDEALIASLETALTPSVSETPSPSVSGGPLRSKEVGSLNARLRHLFAYTPEPPQFSAAETNLLITTIDALKILDPACGSGAFPMGILQKLVFVLGKLDPQNAQWRLRQIAKAEQIDEPAARDHAIADIEQAFAKNDLNYGRKLYLINSGIYGVDIQPIAMQIAKLRFFISLVIDQRIDDAAPNKGVRALPNLETKFVAANTLLGIDKPAQGTFGNQAVEEKEKQLKAVRERHFSARTAATKAKYRDDDKRLREEISTLLEADGWTHDIAIRLAQWDPYNQVLSAGFFDVEAMFGVKTGFDIVIANPPYLGEKGNKETFRAIAQNTWGKKYYQRKMDLFYFFIHRAMDMCKPGSVICFITTNYYITADGALTLRNDLNQRTTIVRLNNFGEVHLFPSALGQHNIITLAVMGQSQRKAFTFATRRRGDASEEILSRILSGEDHETEYTTVPQSELYQGKEKLITLSGSMRVVGATKNSSFEFSKIDAVAEPLSAFARHVFMGVQTGADIVTDSLKRTAVQKGIVSQEQSESYKTGSGIYVLTRNELDDINLTTIEQSECVKDFYKNSQIGRYFTPRNAPKYLLYVDSTSDINRYPNIKAHLMKYRPLLAAREQAVTEERNWFWIRGAKRDSYFYRKDFIVVPYRATTSRFSFCTQNIYGAGDMYYVSLRHGYSTKAMLGYLNSSLVLFHLLKRGKRKGNIIEFYKTPLEQIPVHNLLFQEPCVSALEGLVDKILSRKENNPLVVVRMYLKTQALGQVRASVGTTARHTQV